MFQWTEKYQPQQDWVTFIIVLIFMLCVVLFRNNTHRFKLLVSFWEFRSYINIYDKEKFCNPLHYFNLILTLISLTSFSVMVYFFYDKLLMSMFGKLSFLTFLTFISGVVIGRYWILRLIFKVSGNLELFQQTVFRSLSLYVTISLHGLLLFSFYYYRFFYEPNLLLILLIFIFCALFVSHLSIYLKIIGMKFDYSIYLILYLCAFKLAPWLWLYHSIF